MDAADGSGDRDECADVARGEAVLDDHDRVDEGHEGRLGMDRGVRHGQQGQSQTRARWAVTIHGDAASARALHLPVASRKGTAAVNEGSLEASLIGTVAPLMRHLVAHARRRRTWSELTYQQYNVLRMIDTMGPQPQAEVARRLLVTAPVVTRLASTLADAGLVERGDRPERQASGGPGAHADRTAPGSRHAARPARGRRGRAARAAARGAPRASVAAALEELQVSCSDALSAPLRRGARRLPPRERRRAPRSCRWS